MKGGTQVNRMGNSQVFRPGGALFPRNTHSHSSRQSHEDGCTRRQFKTCLLLLGPLHKSKEDNSQPSRGSPPLSEPNAVPPPREMKRARTIRNTVPKLQAEAEAEKEEHGEGRVFSETRSLGVRSCPVLCDCARSPVFVFLCLLVYRAMVKMVKETAGIFP